MTKRLPSSLLCLVALCLVASCGDAEPNAAEQSPDAGSEDASVEGDAVGDDADATNTSEREPGRYTAMFSDPHEDELFVTYESEEAVRLFELGGDGSWSEVNLPEPLREDPQVDISSVVSTPFDILMTTRESGAWQRELDGAAWESFEAEWIDQSGHIGQLRKHGDQVFAYHYTHEPNGAPIVELWERREFDWSFVQRDVPMIIDYMPKDEMLLRSTSYTTVQISHDGGATWQTVGGLSSDIPPMLFEWGEDVAVTTTTGVWLTRDAGHTFERIASRGGRAAALMGDEVVVADSQGDVAAISLPDGRMRELPRLPEDFYGNLQLAVASDSLFVATGDTALLTLPDGASSWQKSRPMP